MAHAINLDVKSAFTNIQGCIGTLRGLVAAIRVSTKQRERFEHLKRALNSQSAHILGLYVETRWSSTYFMLEASLKAKSVLNTMCSEYDRLSRFSITTSDWTVVQKLCPILELFKDATENQTRTNYVTLSMTIRIHKMQVEALDDFTELES